MLYEIKVKKGHPARRYRIGEHAVTESFKVYDLSDKEEIELTTNLGCNRWVDYVKCEKIEKIEKKEVKKVTKKRTVKKRD